KIPGGGLFCRFFFFPVASLARKKGTLSKKPPASPPLTFLMASPFAVNFHRHSTCTSVVCSKLADNPQNEGYGNSTLSESELANLQCFKSNCLYGGRNRLQVAV